MDTISDFLIAAAEVAAPIALFLEATSMFGYTKQNTTKIISQFGRYIRCTKPGLYGKLPWPFQSVADTVNLRVQVADLDISIITKNNALIGLPVEIHYMINDPISASRLSNTTQQMDKLVQSAIRSHYADVDLADVYKASNEMATYVKTELQSKMEEYGLTIADVVVGNPKISDDLQAALQSVIISANKLAATRNNAEAQKLKVLADAEGQALSKAALGRGIADEQLAIAEGFTHAIEKMKASGITAQQAVSFIETTNYQQRDLEIARAYASGAANVNVFTGGPGAYEGEEGDMGKLAKTILALRPLLDGKQPKPRSAATPDAA